MAIPPPVSRIYLFIPKWKNHRPRYPSSVAQDLGHVPQSVILRERSERRIYPCILSTIPALATDPSTCSLWLCARRDDVCHFEYLHSSKSAVQKKRKFDTVIANGAQRSAAISSLMRDRFVAQRQKNLVTSAVLLLPYPIIPLTKI